MPNNVYAFRRLPEKFRTSWRFVLCVDCEVEYVYEVDIVESKNPFFLYSKGTACDDITYESESGE